MRIVKSANYIPLIDRILGSKEEKSPSKGSTFLDERKELEKQAVKHEMERKAQSEKYPNLQVEAKPDRKNIVSDEDRVSTKAAECLTNKLAELGGKRKPTKKQLARRGGLAGVEVELSEFRSVDSHNDVMDDSIVTDKALLSFAAKFQLPGIGKYKIAKFVVSYTEKNDSPFNVESNFYDENENEYLLTSENLDNFLANTESESVKKANKEAPLAYLNADAGETGAFEVVETVESSDKVAARLNESGFVTTKEWIDTCHDPANFGKLCWLVQVPLNKVAEFKKIAAMSDDDWFNRGKEQSFKKSDTHWDDRALQSGSKYDKKEYKKKDEWVDRAEEPGGHGNHGNPYNSESKMLFADGSKKESNKKILASDTLKDLEDLEKLIK